MNKIKLKEYWDSIDPNIKITVFYSEKIATLGCFSNFYHSDFDFTVKHGIFKGKKYKVEFAEKAIMLSKASLMGDKKTFYAILNASTPYKAKSLGRKVSPFNQDVWDENVCDIAFNVCFSKFSQNSQIRDILLNTGSNIIAEASHTDTVWGIGMHIKDPNNKNKEKWRGYNILGWALMQVRELLR